MNKMTNEVKEALSLIRKTLGEAEYYEQAARALRFDQETICPEKGMERQGEIASFLDNKAFALRKDPAFEEAAALLYRNRDQLEERDAALAGLLHREWLKDKNLTPEKELEYALVFNKAFVDWSSARKAGDYSLFAPSLQKVEETQKEIIALREHEEGETPKALYDIMLDDYERGIDTARLDPIFDECRERLSVLLEKICKSPKKIRTDFLARPVSDAKQQELGEYLLDVMGFDFSRGALATTEHPFTEGIGPDDVRVTTHYYQNRFDSSMYSIIHEGGHALFEMYQPREDHEHFITPGKTLGMHESVSRFYENRIGRSREFIEFVYPKMCEIMPDVMNGVSALELYEALNEVKPSLIRTEADEFTYTFHIIIRYELEKEIAAGTLKIEDAAKAWREKYKEILGICPENDREGILQDVHWSSGFGYFPTYAIGNFYNAMYFNRMKQEIDVPTLIARGELSPVNDWMIRNVFAKADLLSPAEWIADITGRELTAGDFLDYLEEKYSRIYEL